MRVERVVGLWLLSSLGCRPVVSPSDGTDATSGSATTTSSSSESSATSGESTGTSEATGSSSTDEGSAYVMRPDGGGTAPQCDVFVQDCLTGQKCVPCWTEYGGWESTQCVPLVAEPRAVGTSCTVAACYDDCGPRAVCAWLANPRARDGVCTDLCVGDELAPSCEDPEAVCLSRDAVPMVCSSPCDPLDPQCPSGTFCQHYREAFTCAPAWAMGTYGAACRTNGLDCPDGLVCASGGGGCSTTEQCCTNVCDLGDLMPGAICPAAMAGQICQPFVPDGQSVAGAENVGACVG